MQHLAYRCCQAEAEACHQCKEVTTGSEYPRFYDVDIIFVSFMDFKKETWNWRLMTLEGFDLTEHYSKARVFPTAPTGWIPAVFADIVYCLSASSWNPETPKGIEEPWTCRLMTSTDKKTQKALPKGKSLPSAPTGWFPTVFADIVYCLSGLACRSMSSCSWWDWCSWSSFATGTSRSTFTTCNHASSAEIYPCGARELFQPEGI